MHTARYIKLPVQLLHLEYITAKPHDLAFVVHAQLRPAKPMRASHCGVSGHRDVCPLLCFQRSQLLPDADMPTEFKVRLAFFRSLHIPHGILVEIEEIPVTSPPFLHTPATIIEKAGARTPPALMQAIWVS